MTSPDTSSTESDDVKHRRKRLEEGQSKKESSKKEESTRRGSKAHISRRSKTKRSRSKHRSRSLSPQPSERKYYRDDRDNPDISHCLGVFGLSTYTEERDLKEVFAQYGPLDNIFIIYDRYSGRSKGYGFVYFKSTTDAIEARKACQGLKLDGRPIRVDYSLTTRPHAPTPGRYLGRPRPGSGRDYYDDDYDSGYSRYSSRRSRSRDYCDRDYYRDCSDDYKRRSQRYSPYSRHY